MTIPRDKTMSDEELDEVRAKAAWQATSADKLTRFECLNANVQEAIILAARYGRENWTPADPDLALAREVALEYETKVSEQKYDEGARTEARRRLLSGELDEFETVQIALAAIRATRAEARPF
jgi:hypothetical protein